MEEITKNTKILLMLALCISQLLYEEKPSLPSTYIDDILTVQRCRLSRGMISTPTTGLVHYIDLGCI